MEKEKEKEKEKALSKLTRDLRRFLSVLDSENLSYVAQAQKKSISELLSSLRTLEAPAEDAEYVVMSRPSSERKDGESPVRTGDPLRPNDDETPRASDGEDETYEEARPYRAGAPRRPAENEESESSYYESYGEREEEEEEEEEDLDEDKEKAKDRAHYIRWSSSQPCLRAPQESRLCGYLWRRRWLGQWSKQLFIIRKHTLLCYKCVRDLLPQLELSLRGCRPLYKLKSRRKIRHRLKLLLPGGDAVVLGYATYRQADEWRRTIEELSGGGAENDGWELPPRSRRPSSVLLNHTNQQQSSCLRHKNKGVLSVLMNCQWQSLLCQVEAGILNMFAAQEEEEEEEEEEGGRRGARSPQYELRLRGCRVKAAPDGPPPHRITLSVPGEREQLAVLEVASADEKRRWTRLLEDAAAAFLRDETPDGGHTLNTYTERPSRGGPPSPAPPPLYSNTPVLEHKLRGSGDATYANAVLGGRPEPAPRGVQKLELAGGRGGRVAGAASEADLPSAGDGNRRSSFRRSLAVCGERAQASLLKPLLRRAASVRSSATARGAPSEDGKLFHGRKEWESKAAA